MNEKMLAKQLEHDLDSLLDGRSLPNNANVGDDYRKALDAARLLASHDMSNESRIRKTLRQKLLSRISDQPEEWHPIKKGNYPMKTRSKLPAFVGAIAVIVLMAALPTVQAFAQKIWNQIGPFIVIAQDNPYPAPPADFNPTPLPGGPTAAPTQLPASTSNGPTPIAPDPNVRIISREVALSQLNFKMLTPSYVPEGFTLIDVPNNNVVFVGPGYINSAMVYTSVDNTDLQITQSTFDPKERFPFYVGDVGITQIKVRGKDAVFVKDAIMGVLVDANGQAIPVNYLLWEEDGLFFMIQASKLTQDEIVKVAESLK